jgi:acetyl-CoA acetyltransferase
MSSRVVVAGVGMIPFTTPRTSEPYDVMAEAAARKALEDAGIEYASVRQGYVGYVYGDSTSGQAALYGLGQTGIPILNVNNNCSTGSSALFLARQAIETGAADCVIALGFEQMMRGALGSMWSDRPSPFTRFDDATKALQGWDEQAPMAAQYFGGAGTAYAEKYGSTPRS